MEKLSQQNLKLLCFINTYKSASYIRILQVFNSDTRVTKLRIDELKTLNLIEERKGQLLLTPKGRMHVADVKDCKRQKRYDFWVKSIITPILVTIVTNFLIYLSKLGLESLLQNTPQQ